MKVIFPTLHLFKSVDLKFKESNSIMDSHGATRRTNTAFADDAAGGKLSFLDDDDDAFFQKSGPGGPAQSKDKVNLIASQ